jgi:MFS family permease
MVTTIEAAPARRTLTRAEVRTLMLAALGGALEYYDFIIFVFLAAPISRIFFPAETPEWLRLLQTWSLFAAGYVARPLGGVIMAHFGDRTGRKRMFTLSVFLMAVPTLLIGLLPTFATASYAAPLLLLLMRILQGAAVGGEIPGAWTFVAEHVPERRMAFACGALTAGLTVGILIGSLVAGAVNKVYNAQELADWGWRVPFLIGGAFGLLAVFLRRLLAETPVFEELRRRRALVEGLPLKVVLAGHGRAVILTMLLTWSLTAGIVVVILMTPTLLTQLYGIPGAQTLAANTLATLMLCLGCVFYGLLADRFSPSHVLAVGAAILLAATYALYAGAGRHPELLTVLYAIAGFGVGVVGVIPALLVRAFPAPVRFSGISFAYNVAYAIFGGLTPLVVATLMKAAPLAPAHYVGAMCVMAAIVALLMDGDRREPAPGAL